MARNFLSSGDEADIGFVSSGTELFGTNGNEIVNVGARAVVTFDASFNRGGDVINIAGNAASYTATIVGGSRLVLTGTNGAVLDIPVGGVGVTINFGDAANRSLKFDNDGHMLLGGQTIATVGSTAITAGSGGSGGDNGGTGTAYYLTSGNDNLTGTAGNDQFFAYLSQNPFIGGVSNSLSSGDIIRGGAGQDSLFAQLVPEFYGATGGYTLDVQPIINSVERIEFEARDLGTNLGSSPQQNYSSYSGSYASSSSSQTTYVDGKYITGHVRIGSKQSDGDLVIENLTTLAANGTTARNTEDITITMDHTDNFNSDEDASDLFVFFDDDYLLAGQSRTTSQANYWLLDQDSTDYANVPLNHIDRTGVTLKIDGTDVAIKISDTVAGIPKSWDSYAAALQTVINQMILTGTTILQGITVKVDWTNTKQTYNDAGQLVTIPAITLLDANGRDLEPTGYLFPQGTSEEFNIYGRFNSDPSVSFDNPVTVNIELDKVGRNGEGGDLIIGGKNGDKGIEVFNISVQGTGDRPSSLGTVASTGGALEEVHIKTDAAYVNAATHASLTIRDGFGDSFDYSDDPAVAGGRGSIVPRDLRLVDADAFLGDLTLGSGEGGAILNLDTLVARGGGNVTFYGELDGYDHKPFSYTTGAGNDKIYLDLDGDALDYAQSSVTVSTGAGNDEVHIGTGLYGTDEVVNQAILRNITVDTGTGNDLIKLDAGTVGTAVINAGAGDDVVYTDGSPAGPYATWAFNFDSANPPSTTDDLQGVQTSLRYFGDGAKLRVVLSGAGIVNQTDGGGVMANGDASWKKNGYEVEVSLGKLIGGNKYFGDQRDINAALIKAINEDPILSKLLVAEITENNTIVVTSLTSGYFAATDLEVTVLPKANPTDANTQYAQAVLDEARALTHNSALTLANLWTNQAPATNALYVGPMALGTDTQQDAWYNGLGENQTGAYWQGYASDHETDTIINGGAGNDLIVLSTDASGGSAPAATISSHTALLNGASNETVVIGEVGAKYFGIDTIMNFSTAGWETTVAYSASGNASVQSQSGNAGLDFLDFSVYLTSLQDLSANDSGSSATHPDNNVSNTLIPVTLELSVAANPAIDAYANEVVIVRFVADSGHSWGSLGATQIQALFNTDTGSASTADYGNLWAQNFWANDEYIDQTSVDGTNPLVDGAGGPGQSAKAILMVENDANRGEYKVFELSWNGHSTADGDTKHNGQVTAAYQGSLDFGTSLDGIHAINLVGSASYNALLATGFYNPIA